MDKKKELKENGIIKKISNEYIDKKALITTFISLFIIYLLFVGLPWIWENKEELLGKDSDFIIKIPFENFGVEPNQILDPYWFDLIPKDKNEVVNIIAGRCEYNWPNWEIKEKSEEEHINNQTLQSDENFIPTFPLPLDSPRRLYCHAVRLPDKPGEYYFTIYIESEKAKESKQVKFYVTKPLGELST